MFEALPPSHGEMPAYNDFETVTTHEEQSTTNTIINSPIKPPAAFRHVIDNRSEQHAQSAKTDSGTSKFPKHHDIELHSIPEKAENSLVNIVSPKKRDIETQYITRMIENSPVNTEPPKQQNIEIQSIIRSAENPSVSSSPNPVQITNPVMLVPHEAHQRQLIKQNERPSVEQPMLMHEAAHESRELPSNSVEKKDASLPEQTAHRVIENRIDRINTSSSRTTERAQSASSLSQTAKPTNITVQRNEFSAVTTTPAARVLKSVVAEPSPPSVQITIGRVDVRAVMAQPVAPRREHASQPQTPSLADYLKQRNGGR